MRSHLRIAEPHSRRHASLWALVLAGGDGKRLRDLTQLICGEPIPKQYCRFADERSLLETTIDRAARLVPPDRTLTIVNQQHLALARSQLRGLPAENVIVQPSNRDTGPGMLFALLALVRRAPDALVVALPSDHHVRDEAAVAGHLERAARVVDLLSEQIALLGIRPDRPEAGLGYVEPGRPVVAAGGSLAFRVNRFVEKPGAEQALHIMRRGGLWNSFILVFRAARMLELIAMARPADFAAMCAVVGTQAVAESYAALPSWNLSSGLLARVADQLVVLEATDVGWSDWGTRESIERTFSDLDRTPPWHATVPPLLRAVGGAA